MASLLTVLIVFLVVSKNVPTTQLARRSCKRAERWVDGEHPLESLLSCFSRDSREQGLTLALITRVR